MPRLMAMENDSLNGVPMLVSYLLTNRAQVFADVRTCWSPDAIERVTGRKVDGVAAGGLINSGSAALDGSGQQVEDGVSAMKPFWEISEEEKDACLAAMLRIPVFMHNIEDGDVYRPRAWSPFGTDGLEGADFRAIHMGRSMDRCGAEKGRA